MLVSRKRARVRLAMPSMFMVPRNEVLMVLMGLYLRMSERQGVIDQRNVQGQLATGTGWLADQSGGTANRHASTALAQLLCGTAAALPGGPHKL